MLVPKVVMAIAINSRLFIRFILHKWLACKFEKFLNSERLRQEEFRKSFVPALGLSPSVCFLATGGWDNSIHAQVLHHLSVVVPRVAQCVHHQARPGAVARLLDSV